MSDLDLAQIASDCFSKFGFGSASFFLNCRFLGNEDPDLGRPSRAVYRAHRTRRRMGSQGRGTSEGPMSRESFARFLFSRSRFAGRLPSPETLAKMKRVLFHRTLAASRWRNQSGICDRGWMVHVCISKL